MAARKKKKWSGMCPAGRHGLDREGQECDLCPKPTKKFTVTWTIEIETPPEITADDVHEMFDVTAQDTDTISDLISEWSENFPEFKKVTVVGQQIDSVHEARKK